MLLAFNCILRNHRPVAPTRAPASLEHQDYTVSIVDAYSMASTVPTRTILYWPFYSGIYWPI